jgi:hypothetical protein
MSKKWNKIYVNGAKSSGRVRKGGVRGENVMIEILLKGFHILYRSEKLSGSH